jgi:DNA-binding NtrC family response regulator
MIVLSIDPEVRQIVESLEGTSRWRVRAVDETSALFNELNYHTQIVVLDEAVTGTGYLAIVRKVRRTAPEVDVTVIGGPKADDLLIHEHSEGVDQYHTRPLDVPLLEAGMRHRMRFVELKHDCGLVGRSLEMEEVVEAVLQVGPTEVPILIEGESGTGKDIVARAVHNASRRRERSFEAINCGAVAEGVLESELFGHEKGAFTGAVARRAGMFERADRGTIFLDEVGETSPAMQVKLLRVVESGDFTRVGGVDNIHVDVRIVAATNRRLGEAVRNGSFRQDLYYRLKGVNLFLPPLRTRKEDIPILIQHFIADSNRRHHKSIRGLDPAAGRRMAEYSWPGNIRELKNTVDTLVVLAPGSRITEAAVIAQLSEAPEYGGGQGVPSMLPVALNRSKDEAEREMIYASILALHRDVREIMAMLQKGPGPAPWEGLKEVRPEPPGELDADLGLAQIERSAIRGALNRYAGNRRKAAEALGISERTLYRKIKEYGLI